MGTVQVVFSEVVRGGATGSGPDRKRPWRWYIPDFRGIWEPLLIYFKLWSHVMSEICSFLVIKKLKGW